MHRRHHGPTNWTRQWSPAECRVGETFGLWVERLFMLRYTSSSLRLLRWVASNSRRLFVTLLGFAVLGAGLAMLVLPGPGVVVILLGLALLATEFAWAERALDRTANRAAAATSRVTASRSGTMLLGASAVSMIVGGGTAAVVLSERRMLGASLVVAGVIALSVLVPRVRRWVEARASRAAGAGAPFVSPGKEHDEPVTSSPPAVGEGLPLHNAPAHHGSRCTDGPR